jgi:hypothetical protein
MAVFVLIIYFTMLPKNLDLISWVAFKNLELINKIRLKITGMLYSNSYALIPQ